MFQTLTYLLTPRNRVLLGKLAGSHLVKKFPAFYGTQMFNTAFTSPYPESKLFNSYSQIPLPEDPS